MLAIITMKPYLTAIIAIVCFNFCKAQNAETRSINALSLEIGKTGLIFNLNYDHKIKNTKVGFRLGVGASPHGYAEAVIAGGGGYFLAGSTSHFLELGIDLQYLVVDEVSDDQKGIPFVYPDYSIKTLYPSLNVGYRKYGKKSLFRIGLAPGIINAKPVPGGYISIGMTF